MGDGYVPLIKNFDDPLLSGFYGTHTDQSKFPTSTWGYPYKFLLNMRADDNTEHHQYQWQIATEWVDNDRIYFRKIYPYGVGNQATWHELATRGDNKFIGTQRIDGILIAKEVRVQLDVWADFVFSKGYVLPTLDEVKAHIDEHKHLPGIPSETEVKENGIGLSEISTKLLQKVEELTLYAIQQKETIEKLNKRIDELEKSKE